ncbi:MAG: hypothetical protein IJG85_01005 [Eubacteriaceae bacterium]|nr:hypothetical protein [Eubacteriaceae bacterium]
MKKVAYHLIGKITLMTACLMIAALAGCLSGIGGLRSNPFITQASAATVTPAGSTAAAAPVMMLKAYDDFGCASGNQMQYKLDIDDGCVKVKSYYYTATDDHDHDFYLDASTAKIEGNAITFTGVTTEAGQNISDRFIGITMTTNGNTVTMQINRKDAGAGAGDLVGGTYTLAPINSDAYDVHHHGQTVKHANQGHIARYDADDHDVDDHDDLYDLDD